MSGEGSHDLEHTLALYRAIVDTFPNGAVFVFDQELRYTLVGGAGLAEVGLSKEGMEGKTIWELLDAKVIDIVEPKYRAALAGIADTFEAFFAGHFYLVHTLPVQNERGDILAGMAVTQDLTERRRIEEASKRYQQILLEAERIANLCSWEWDIIKDEWTLSDEWLRIHGTQNRHPSLAELMRLAHPEDVASIDREFRRALDDGHVYDIVHRIVRQSDGQVRIVHARGEVLRDDAGQPIKMYGATQDITEPRQVEDQLRASQQEYEDLINTVDSIVWEGDARTFEFSFVSQQAERLLGYPIERWVTEPTFWHDHIHPEDRDWAINFCALATAERRSHEFEYRMLAADGSIVWLRDIVTVVVEGGKPARLRGVMVNITERVEAERALAERTRLLEMGNEIGIRLSDSASLQAMLQGCAEIIVRHLDVACAQIWTFDEVDGKLELQAAAGTHAYPGEPVGPVPQQLSARVGEVVQTRQPLLATQPPPDAATFEPKAAPVQDVDLTAGHPLIVENQLLGVLALYGRHALTSLESEALASAAGGIASGIKRAQAESLLREQEEQYRNVFESVSDGLLIFDIETGRLLDFNPAACQMHGYSPEEFRALEATQFIHPQSHHLFAKHLEDNRQGKQFRYQAAHTRRDGTSFYVDVFATGLEVRGRSQSVSVLRDVTERVQAFELLEQRVAERTHELESLLEVTRSLASTLELTPLLELIMDRLHASVDYRGAGLLALQDDELVLLRYRGPLPEERYHLLVEWWLSHLEPIRRGETVYIPDARDGSALARELHEWSENAQVADVRSLIGIPLMVRERIIGLMMLNHDKPDYYTSQHVQLVTAIANQIAVAIENAQLYEQARRLAALEERQKLARDLHDSVSQALYGISLGARTARALVNRAPADEEVLSKLVPSLDYVLSLADAGLTEMRALIFELRPESLATEGLSAALDRHAAAIQARYRIAVESSLGTEPAVSLALKETLYRVAQEALNNIVKHASADHIDLKLYCEGNALLLEIRDNGCGFDATQHFPGHLGLKSMRERIEAVGGTLRITSAPGQGTTVSAHVPVPPGENDTD